MEKVTQDKIFTMLYSDDPDIKRLGFITLKGYLKTWEDYKRLRGVTIRGRSFFPHNIKKEVKRLGAALRVMPKEVKKKRRITYGIKREDKAYALLAGQGDEGISCQLANS